MPETLNISLAPGQLAWLKARKTEAGFASASDVVRELIRREQEAEHAALAREFHRLSSQGVDGSEPVEEIVAIVRQVKKEQREARRLA